MSKPNASVPPGGETPPRRGFVKGFLSILFGGLLPVPPIVAGLGSLFNPLRPSVQKKQGIVGGDDGMFAITNLDSVTAEPRQFTVVAARNDAWTGYPPGPIGAVYLQKTSDTEVRCLQVECPHLGCAVDYDTSKKGFHCPCHDSDFSVDGKRSEKSPSARDLDSLVCEVRDGQVFVKFQKFVAGPAEKIPTA